MGALSAWHWLVLAILVLLMFGYKKLPDAARSVGRSMRIFKSEVGTMREESHTAHDRDRDDPPARPVPPPPVIEGETISRPTASAAEEPTASRRRKE